MLRAMSHWRTCSGAASISGREKHAVTVAAAGKGGPKLNKQGARRQREIVVGIDLGTTNSAVAYIEPGGKPRCIPNEDGNRTTPSVVAFLPEGEVAVGTRAKKEAPRNAATTYSSTKRLIGRRFDDPVVQQEQPRLPFQVLAGDKGEVCLECAAVSRGFIYPEEVSAQILVQLLDDAERYTGGEVRKAIISVPAYFNTQQREATANAGALAGLDVVRLIREPVAAALAYGLNLKEDQTVLVFDLGGGTYDISLLEVGNGTIEVLSTGGDPHLGGDDWDSVIMEHIIREHLGGRPKRNRGNRDNSDSEQDDDQGGSKGLLDFTDGRVLANLKALAEAAKVGLSSSEEVTLRMPVGGPGGGPQSVQLTRKRLEELSVDLWRRCRLPLDQACWAAGVDLNAIVGEAAEKREELRKRGVPSWKTETLTPIIKPRSRPPLTKVLLVGGTTRMPAVSQFIRNMTGLEPEQGIVNPDEAVALGAAVQAGVLQGEVKDFMIIDQWQASLMRSLAQLQLAQDPSARAAMEQQFDLSDGGDDDNDEEFRRQEAAILAKLDEENAAEDAAEAARAVAAAALAEDHGSESDGSGRRQGDSSAGRSGREATGGSSKPELSGSSVGVSEASSKQNSGTGSSSISSSEARGHAGGARSTKDGENRRVRRVKKRAAIKTGRVGSLAAAFASTGSSAGAVVAVEQA